MPPDEIDRAIEARSDDAAFTQRQPGFLSTQLHRGVAGSATLINVATWESASALRKAFSTPEFQSRLARYPDGTVTSPHVFTKVSVPGICGGGSSRPDLAAEISDDDGPLLQGDR